MNFNINISDCYSSLKFIGDLWSLIESSLTPLKVRRMLDWWKRCKMSE